MISTDEYVAKYTHFVTEYLTCLKNGTKFDPGIHKIQSSMWKKALEDFQLFGKLVRYPKKYIFLWRDYCITNIALLEAMTDLYGHSSSFPFTEFNDVFFYNADTGYIDKELYDYTAISEIIESLEEASNNKMTWSNGQYFLSDYGLPILIEHLKDLLDNDDADKLLVTINKVLNVIHMRSDLAELFIIGGSSSLDLIEL